MHSSVSVADRFLDLARAQEDALTPMQLLKLVFLAHGWMLGLYGRPLISEEVQAWQYGPVIPKLYDAVRSFRSMPVTHVTSPKEDFTDLESDIITQVYKLYGQKSGPELSRLTHLQGSPWHAVYKQGSFGTVISNDLIEDYYARLAAKARKAAAEAVA